ncbi:hypothetical protein [Hyphomonas sp.]|uniref:hypothetical protein n=1 Tax=Hyphomonas sp. TaxID=87 RepID=UPI003F700800
MSRVSLPAILLATALALPVATTACASEPVAEVEAAETLAETADSEKQPHRVIVKKMHKVSLDEDTEVNVHSKHGEKTIVRVMEHGKHTTHVADCSAGEGEDGPVKYEFRDESEDGSEVEVSVICLTGDEAKPENKAAALEKAIAHMEAEGEREAAHRARTLEKLKAALAKLKAESE